MTTLNKSDLQKCAEQSGLQVDGRSEFAYTDRLEQFSRLIRLDLELEITYLRDQLAKAEQRVAEACALQVATEIKFHWLDAARVAKEIRSGEWRKLVKEEV